jgi:putative oxidoreductase
MYGLNVFDAGMLALRLVVGGLIFAHGMQKLAGWFGGAGLPGMTKMMAGLGLQPAEAWAVVAALSEVVGGALFTIGFLTPVAAFLIIAQMVTAILLVHAPNGLWNTNRGWEYNLVLIAVAAVVSFLGPGVVAVDGLIGWSRSDVLTSTALVVAAIASGAAVAELGPAALGASSD